MAGKGVFVCKADEVGNVSSGQTNGMTRRGAIHGQSDLLNGTLMIAQPHTESDVHHHNDQDTIVYSVKGQGGVEWSNGKEFTPLNPGDWLLIPAYCEHKEINSGDEETHWVIVRSGGTPKVENLRREW